MVDILDRDDSRQFGCLGRFRRFAEPSARRSEPAEPALAVDEADIEVAEAHDMVAGFELGDADEFADQGLAEEEALAAPGDLARAAHAPDLVIGVIPGILDTIRHGARRGCIECCWGPLPQRFVRPLLVVVMAEGVEAGLLCGRRYRRRTRGLRLQRAMHALVAGVVLRRSRADEVRGDAEL